MSIKNFDRNITRGEMVEIMYRLLTENEGKESVVFEEGKLTDIDTSKIWFLEKESEEIKRQKWQ
ncbi:hypothetical protein [Candidatus Venteria ishoeyi]|nr:hypothetical protein [Candidatus Venteria ishoeyi]